MLIPVGYSEVSFIWGGADLPRGGMCSFGVSNPTAAGPATIADVVHGTWTNFIKGIQPTKVSLDAIRVKNGPNDVGPDATVGYGEAGTADTTSVIPNAALVVRKFTDTGGRKGRGRMFLPFVTEGFHVGGGQLNPSDVASDTASLNGWLEALDTAGLPMVLLHTNAPPAPMVVTSLSAEPLIGTQRRRVRG